MSSFTHLHCHSEFSLLDGAIRIKDLCTKANEFKISSVALTDHGNMFGAMQLYIQAKKYGLKPILGCEVYIAPHGRKNRDNRERYHLLLLAQNITGYNNLIRLVSKGFTEGFFYRPRVDKELLLKYNEGLIACSACLQGEIPYTLLHKGLDEGIKLAQEYEKIFPNRFYLELQSNGIKEQTTVNESLQAVSEKTKIPLIATNDCHYLNKEDAKAHDILLCIGTGKTVNDPNRLRFSTSEFYYKSPTQMKKEFSHCPEAINNIEEIVERCNLELEMGRNIFPNYEVPENQTAEQLFIKLVQEGLNERLRKLPYVKDKTPYFERLEQELEVIVSKGFAPYFLVVQDFINWAKENSIPVGPGRGSAAGSLVAYSLRITDLDPIHYKLFFERFLNAERLSMPDIDVDFCYNRRGEVIDYVSQKYGKERVAQIITFGTMKARGVIRDVARTLEINLKEADQLAKLVPSTIGITLKRALEQEKDLRDFIKGKPHLENLINICERLEGLSRHASVHAAGIVVSCAPLTEYLPVCRGKEKEIITQYDMKHVEKVGLIKFDFLGLKTLTIIDKTLKIINLAGKYVPILDELPLDDKLTYELLSKAETDGIFQLESSGMRGVLRQLKPSCLEDIIALLALYRPGPLESGMVDDFVKRKHGKAEIEYSFACLETLLHPILKDTYGVILYQEQVMQIAQDLANYSLGEGDLLRRAMGKKDPVEMSNQRERFLQGATEKNIPSDAANYIFNLMEKFAGYGFNKSHSAAYAIISYQTAYLKAHYPAEFMAATISAEVNNTDKLIAHISACREQGLLILAPDINASNYEFTVENSNIRYGLSGIKGIGVGAVESLMQEREQNGHFKSLLNFCERVDLRKVNKKVLEGLIKSGAMDCLNAPRAALLESLDNVLTIAQKRAKAKNTGQMSFMTLVETETDNLNGIGIDIPESKIPEWIESKLCSMEKEAFGFYLFANPLLPYRAEISRRKIGNLKQCQELSENVPINIAALITGTKEHLTARGKMAFCQIEDLTGTGEIIIFADTYAVCREIMDKDKPLLITGKIGKSEISDEDEEKTSTVKIIASEIKLLNEVLKNKSSHPIQLSCPATYICEDSLDSLKKILAKHPGADNVELTIIEEDYTCSLLFDDQYLVFSCPDFLKDFKNWSQNQLEKL